MLLDLFCTLLAAQWCHPHCCSSLLSHLKVPLCVTSVMLAPGRPAADSAEHECSFPAPTAEVLGQNGVALSLLQTVSSAMVPPALLSLLAFPPKTPFACNLSGGCSRPSCSRLSNAMHHTYIMHTSHSFHTCGIAHTL